MWVLEPVGLRSHSVRLVTELKSWEDVMSITFDYTLNAQKLNTQLYFTVRLSPSKANQLQCWLWFIILTLNLQVCCVVFKHNRLFSRWKIWTRASDLFKETPKIYISPTLTRISRAFLLQLIEPNHHYNYLVFLDI